MKILDILTMAILILSSPLSLHAQTQGKVYDWQMSMEKARNN